MKFINITENLVVASDKITAIKIGHHPTNGRACPPDPENWWLAYTTVDGNTYVSGYYDSRECVESSLSQMTKFIEECNND